MKQITGNFWDEIKNYDAICVTTNGIVKSDGCLVMGTGIAKDFKERYKYIKLDYQLGQKVKEYGNFVMHVPLFFPDKPFGIFSIPTKNDWKNPSDIELIKTSCITLSYLASQYGYDSVLLTRLGCGNGGLTWDSVCPIIAPILDDRFTVINKE